MLKSDRIYRGGETGALLKALGNGVRVVNKLNAWLRQSLIYGHRSPVSVLVCVERDYLFY